MKKLVVLFLISLVFHFSYGQKASISISHTLTYDSVSVLPDSIMITNMTQGNDTTLYGNDTTLVLDYTVGINENQKDHDAFVVMPNYPNPFNSQTYFEVIIPEDANLNIKVYDLVSKEISGISSDYPAGKHKFSFTTGHGGLYFLSVRFNNKTSSIMMFCSGFSKDIRNEISYVSSQKITNNKLVKNVKSYPFAIGDELRSIVYYQSMSDTALYKPTQDTLIIVNFQSSSICPASFVDTRDNNIYTAVQIGTQCWMAKNLAYLPVVFPSDSGTNISPYYYVYDYQGTDVNAAKATSNYQTFGVLYNWWASLDGDASSNSVPSGVQGICPSGWHLPSDEEWKILEGEIDSLYGYPDPEWDTVGFRGFDAGGNLKETGTTHWNSPNTGATNSSGFTALPGGFRSYDGSFYYLGVLAHFWSSTEYTKPYAWYRSLGFGNAGLYRGYLYEEAGFSVRCAKD